MASETSFSVVDSGSGLGPFWRSLGDLWFFGWLGNLWFSTLADTEAGRSQIKRAIEDHEALKTSKAYSQVLQVILDDPQYPTGGSGPGRG